MLGIVAYARIVGLLLLATAAWGQSGGGWNGAEVGYEVVAGLLFLVIGFLFSKLGTTTVCRLVEGMGWLLVFAEVLELSALWTMGPGSPWHGPFELVCVLVGPTSILAARYLPEESGLGHDEKRAS